MDSYLNQSIPIMLTVKQTAERFGIAQHHARQLALTGKVHALRAGRKILINAQSVAELFNTCSLSQSEGNQPIKL